MYLPNDVIAKGSTKLVDVKLKVGESTKVLDVLVVGSILE